MLIYMIRPVWIVFNNEETKQFHNSSIPLHKREGNIINYGLDVDVRTCRVHTKKVVGLF
jgi:hypothetical protein